MIWKDIKGYGGKVQISDTGLYKRKAFEKEVGKKINNYKEHITAGAVNADGYRQVYLPDGKRAYIHRLVAEAFIDNPDSLPIINHKDENPSNNNADNLEGCDARHNILGGTAKERMVEKQKKTPVKQYDSNGNLIKEYASLSEASRETGVTKGNIYNSIKNNCKAGGYYGKK